ncbi:MAG: 3-methyl-2-oxobutanoate dehydrogenase subunit VorB [Clostridiales bacterium]|nr:3-methyl-2-oxobutanoate dehydrogenase subunit VorB [Clostridiales bacterium]
MRRELWKGNEAIAEAAIRAGCRFYFGYPITPQSEIPEYMAAHLPERGGVFPQAESEISAINMVYGAAGAGARVMTSSSSPGVSLKQEGISFIVGAELPAVIVNVMRSGPGLGGIQPAQGDYFQATRGGGNGDYHHLVLAPNSIQEAVDLMQLAFELADKYRNPVMILADGMIGQMMEPVEWKKAEITEARVYPEWATTGRGGRENHRIVNSLYIESEIMEAHVHHLFSKYKAMEENEVLYEESGIEDAEVVLVAYGVPARIADKAVELLKEEGIKAGLFRPITLWPYPKKRLNDIASLDHVKNFVVVELSMGQMLEDVQLSVNGKKPVHFHGRPGGAIPSPGEVKDAVKKFIGRES